MNLKRSEFQVQELNRVFLDKQEGKTADEKMATCDEMQLKMQVATLEAMNVELGGQLKEEKNARRMLEGKYLTVRFMEVFLPVLTCM